MHCVNVTASDINLIELINNLCLQIMRNLLSCIGWITCLRRISPYTSSSSGFGGGLGPGGHPLDATMATSYSSLTSMDKSEHDDLATRGSNQRTGTGNLEWRIMATVLDRLCFVLFLATSLLLPLMLTLVMYCNA